MLYTDNDDNDSADDNKGDGHGMPLVFIVQNDGVPKIYEFDLDSLDFKMVKKLNSTFAANTSLVLINDYLFVSNIEGKI